MIGYNTLVLNQAEMMRAIEYYLNNVQFKESTQVTSVSENKSDNTFLVIVGEVKESEA